MHGYEVEKVDYNGKTIELACLHVGWEYATEGIFEGSRHAANREQAIQFAQEDIDSQGKAHAWRERDEGGAGWKHAVRQGRVKV